jgi:3-methylfumaryl-CoA hydratase
MADLNLQDWVGKTEAIADRIYTTPVRALAQTLNYKDFDPREGNPLPEIWYWLYFLPIVPMSQVGPDGHPKRGGFLPPITLERRMWASGNLTFHQDLVIGEEIRKTSEILEISEKEGKAGKLVFVTVKHLIQSARGVAVEEQQNIVYLHMPKSFVEPSPNPLPEDLVWKEEYRIDPVLLFRFSALTFNGHRIHYDRKYAMEVEKYPGLVVHGPLQALLLMESAKNHNPGKKPATFNFKAVRPIFDFDKLHIGAKSNLDGSHALYTANTDSNIGMQATVTWR